MALPTSGPISFADLNTDRGIAATTQVDLRAAALSYGFVTPDSMDEFYNVPLYDVYESCNAPSPLMYYVQYFNSNPYYATIGGAYCYIKIATQVHFPFITTWYPNVPFTSAISNDGCSCDGGGGGGPID
jgi:hypothetical protein